MIVDNGSSDPILRLGPHKSILIDPQRSFDLPRKADEDDSRCIVQPMKKYLKTKKILESHSYPDTSFQATFHTGFGFVDPVLSFLMYNRSNICFNR